MNLSLSFSILASVQFLSRNIDWHVYSLFCSFVVLHWVVCLLWENVLLAGFGILNWQMMFMVLTLNLWPGQANSVLKSWNLLQTLTCNDFVWYEIWEIGKLHSVLRLFPTSIWLLFPKAQICDNQDQIGANLIKWQRTVGFQGDGCQ